MTDADREQMYQQIGAGNPAGRVGEIADVVQGYLYCMTQHWSTCTVLHIDGGTLLA